jgi:hypothetical protein
VGHTIPTAPILYSTLNKTAGPINERVVIGLDVPVFRGYYNELTDPEPKPSHRDDPTVIIEPWEDRYPDNMADGITLGAEIKVQVTKIYRLGYVYPHD